MTFTLTMSQLGGIFVLVCAGVFLDLLVGLIVGYVFGRNSANQPVVAPVYPKRKKPEEIEAPDYLELDEWEEAIQGASEEGTA